MDSKIFEELPGFLEILGLDEEPMGLYFTDEEPEDGFTPKPLPTPTREKEEQNAIDWQEVFGGFSCVMGNIWRARRKKTRAWFSADHFGCPGGGFWLGFYKPQTETIIHYVSTGIPNVTEGEWYCSSPDDLRRLFGEIDPVPAPAKYCVVQPLSLFGKEQEPRFVHFFARPETIAGLHQLAAYVTDDPEVVASPWSAACGGIVTWPMRYQAQGKTKAVIGGWDPSARKFFKADEISFTVPWPMFQEMLAKWQESFLGRHTWDVVRQKIKRSKKMWGELKEE